MPVEKCQNCGVELEDYFILEYDSRAGENGYCGECCVPVFVCTCGRFYMGEDRDCIVCDESG